MTYQSHPLADRYPLLGGEAFDLFKADVAVHGCREPIRTFQGKILDGRNRYRACVELGVDPPLVEFVGTEDEARAAVDSWNLHRRHLTVEFRRGRVAELRGQGMSLRAIAKEVGVDVGTVHRDLAIIKQSPVEHSTPAAAPPRMNPMPRPIVQSRSLAEMAWQKRRAPGPPTNRNCFHHRRARRPRRR